MVAVTKKFSTFEQSYYAFRDYINSQYSPSRDDPFEHNIERIRLFMEYDIAPMQVDGEINAGGWRDGYIQELRLLRQRLQQDGVDHKCTNEMIQAYFAFLAAFAQVTPLKENVKGSSITMQIDRPTTSTSTGEIAIIWTPSMPYSSICHPGLDTCVGGAVAFQSYIN